MSKTDNQNYLCDKNCNECPIILHKNSRVLTKIFNKLYDELGGEVLEIINETCPNLSVCYDCRIDDFCHMQKCKIID